MKNEVAVDQHAMVVFAEATNRLGDHCGFVWCHCWDVIIAFVLKSTHKLDIMCSSGD